MQKLFLKNGYVKIRLLNIVEADELRKKYFKFDQLHDADESVHSTADTANQELIEAVDFDVTKTISPKLNFVLHKYRPILGIYLIKDPGSNSFKDWHQDWSMVDETQFVSASVWCALEDVNEYNGALRVVPGSHLFSNKPRCAPKGRENWGFKNLQYEFDKLGITIPLKAGEAVIYNHALIHSSHPNRSTEQRVAAVIGIYDEAAQLLHYYSNENSQATVYAITPQFFYQVKKHDQPEGFDVLKREVLSGNISSPLSLKLLRLKATLQKMFIY